MHQHQERDGEEDRKPGGKARVKEIYGKSGVKVWRNLHAQHYKVSVQLVEIELRRTRGHSYKLMKKGNSTSQCQKFFSMRVVNLWNRI